MDENEIFDALGVVPEQSQGENEPVGGREAVRAVVDCEDVNDARQPTGEDHDHDGNGGQNAHPALDTGGKEQEDAEPAPDGNNGQEPTEDQDGQKPQEQSEEERRENAARRRRLEQQEAVDRAVQEAVARERESFRKEREQFYQSAGLKNTITGEPITSDEQFRAWKSAFDAQRIAEDLKKGELTPEVISRAVAESPAVKRLEELTAQEEAKAREAKEARRLEEEARARERIDAELAEIHRLDPSINGVEDLVRMEGAEKFREYVQRGNTFLDAYYLTNREKLAQQQAQAAQRQAQEAARSKDHLKSLAKPAGMGARSVPKADMELFRLLNPDATEAEIQSYYNRQQN